MKMVCFLVSRAACSQNSRKHFKTQEVGETVMIHPHNVIQKYLPSHIENSGGTRAALVLQSPLVFSVSVGNSCEVGRTWDKFRNRKFYSHHTRLHEQRTNFRAAAVSPVAAITSRCSHQFVQRGRGCSQTTQPFSLGN